MVPFGTKIELHGYYFLRERKIQGSSMGGNRFRVDMPRLVEFYRQGKLHLDHLISGTIRLDQINEGFAALKSAQPARQDPPRPDPPRRSTPAQPAKPARRPPPGEEELFEPALVDGRLRLARVDRTAPDDPRDKPLTPEDFAARIRARKAEL